MHGAAGGVGLAAVDLGRVYGAKVIATASSDAKRSFLKDYGADLVLPSSGFREAVKEFTGGKGADVIYDPVGGDVFDESVRCIAFNGRLLVIGFTSGRIPTIAANMPLIKGFSVVGVRAGRYGRKNPARAARISRRSMRYWPRRRSARISALGFRSRTHSTPCARSRSAPSSARRSSRRNGPKKA